MPGGNYQKSLVNLSPWWIIFCQSLLCAVWYSADQDTNTLPFTLCSVTDLAKIRDISLTLKLLFWSFVTPQVFFPHLLLNFQLEVFLISKSFILEMQFLCQGTDCVAGLFWMCIVLVGTGDFDCWL